MQHPTAPEFNFELGSEAAKVNDPSPTLEKSIRNNPPFSTFDWPNDLIEQIQEVMQTPCNMPTAPEFNFELNDEAAKHNEAILSKYNFNLGQALKANKDSLLGPGQEFKPTDVLSRVFGMHP